MLALAGLLAFGAGCASKEAMTGKEQADAPTAGIGSSTSSAGSEFVEKTEIDDERTMPGSLLANRLIHFDFDKSAVLPEYAPTLSAHSTFLVSDRSKAVVLQGHADERGSDEYNLALGQRRSDAVREVILASGVLDHQIETVSFGEARPRALGHNETAWRENRRVEIIYTDE
jgi:peptidoglycan-associated lipoprotein